MIILNCIKKKVKTKQAEKKKQVEKAKQAEKKKQVEKAKQNQNKKYKKIFNQQ